MAQPTVFLSSASVGMSDLREALRYTLTQRGFEVLAFEDAAFPISGNRGALDECLSVVRGADYYLLVIGNEAGRVENGRSPTREEFRAARESQNNTGKPKNILTVRTATRAAVDRHRRGDPTPELSNPEFISDFVDEVESSSSEDPNWLHRFSDFGELMDTLVTRLQLGRDREQTLARRAVLAEVLQDLAQMVWRSGESAFPLHWWGQHAQESITFTKEMIDRDFKVTRKVALSLGTFSATTHLSSISNRSMERVLHDGHLLDFSVDEQRYVPSQLHLAIRRVVADIDDSKATLSTSNNWRLNLMAAAAEASRTGRSVLVSGQDVVWALACHNRVENLFNGLVALATLLLKGEGSGMIEEGERRPASPIEGVAQDIWRETVEPEEIEHLIVSDIRPFGTRIAATAFTEEQLVELSRKLAEKHLGFVQQVLESHGLDPADGELLQRMETIAKDVLKSLRAQPGEGIANRS